MTKKPVISVGKTYSSLLNTDGRSTLEYDPSKSYTFQQTVVFENRLYTVSQTTQPGQTPTSHPQKFTNVMIPGPYSTAGIQHTGDERGVRQLSDIIAPLISKPSYVDSETDWYSLSAGLYTVSATQGWKTGKNAPMGAGPYGYLFIHSLPYNGKLLQYFPHDSGMHFMSLLFQGGDWRIGWRSAVYTNNGATKTPKLIIGERSDSGQNLQVDGESYFNGNAVFNNGMSVNGNMTFQGGTSYGQISYVAANNIMVINAVNPVNFGSRPVGIATNGASVGIGTQTPNAAAALHINSTNKGVLFPSMTRAQRRNISNPPDGLLVWQTNDEAGSPPGFYTRRGGRWTRIYDIDQNEFQ